MQECQARGASLGTVGRSFFAISSVILSAAGVERSATPAESKDPYLRTFAMGRDASPPSEGHVWMRTTTIRKFLLSSSINRETLKP